MSVGWFYHDDYLKHDTGQHPERPERLRAIVEHFEKSGLANELVRLTPTPIDPARLAAIHDADYIQRVAATCRSGVRHIDSMDTVICRASYDVALLAAGAAVDAADAVMHGEIERAFVTARPPGHHAEFDTAMGFCLFNNIALAADHLITHHKLERIAIVDFDVHHGNGTQHAFEYRNDVLFISIHQDPATLYPGSGFAREIGLRKGEGFTLNVPMPPGAGDREYQAAFEATILPRLDVFGPQVLLISAGFDAAAEDPLANIELTDAAFTWMTQQLVQIAERHCGGRVISLLEGGYNLAALARCAAAHTRALLS
ncbi:MAG: histone deacetylase [Planctomycetes bacterium]|nr:histone deacetylase [Planctomycetota bacterium]